MKILAYPREKPVWISVLKLTLGVLGITLVFFIILINSLITAEEQGEVLSWQPVVLGLFLSILLAVLLGRHLEKEKHLYWIDEDKKVYLIDSGTKFLEEPESCRAVPMNRMIRDLRSWAEKREKVPDCAFQITEVCNMRRTLPGVKVTCIVRRKRKHFKRKIFIYNDFINGGQLVLALENLWNGPL